ncbi:S41 family peptidase [Streptomyces sp. NPDC002055]|uniref:S41 family peptidase n=1 Tax=Streptomyces sp. NPDC002055 TaxID=3154534 RepID=UPI00331C1FB2
MDGYGTVLAVHRGRLREYQTTAVSCLRGMSGRSTDEGGSGSRAVRFALSDDETGTLTVGPGPRPSRASFQVHGSAGDRGLRRIGALPAACTRPVPDDPRAAFDVFWRSLEENYPFFAAKGIDWQAVRDRYRPEVHAGTTDDELFAVFRKMIEPLHDAHVSIDGGPGRRFGTSRPGTTLPGPDLDRDVTAYIQERDLGGRPLRTFARGRIGFADLPGGLGYLRLSSFSGWTDDRHPGYAAHRKELDRALDAVLTPERTRGMRGLIIDLRINGGGYDALGLRLASRLTDRTHLAYAKRARNDPADPSRHTEPRPVYVRPADAPRFTGPVAVLTGGSTISAGETFTQALMDRPGRTVRIGEPTQGVFSDVMGRALPNGWTVGVPNEEFLTSSGRTFDGAGVPPHLAEPVFTEAEFAHRRDSAFDRALTVLRRRPDDRS